MLRTLVGLLIGGSLLLQLSVAPASGQVPDGTLRITSRMVAPAVGLSWGEGVLTYKGQDYPFTFQATGLFRDVDASLTAAELSGQVFNLKIQPTLAATTKRLKRRALKVAPVIEPA